ncbi:hypothetical protein J2X69_000627 [Algoriphagus sp. 4150]|nr:hypothetical protein [Algoriphagus sp. 4150]
MKYCFTVSLLFFLFLQSCQEENTLNLLEFYWEQTHCTDPWYNNAHESDREILQAVEDYLKEEGIMGAKVISISRTESHLVCYACSCTTGARVNIGVPLTQRSKMIALGFQQSS